ncbi:MAG: hypothetical protein K8S56_09960, partial [Candidatus Cloacimonetes bacterium]|nr:hypothetical protein [Candidatus Cloacimonadota bacterium]
KVTHIWCYLISKAYLVNIFYQFFISEQKKWVAWVRRFLECTQLTGEKNAKYRYVYEAGQKPD